MIVKNENANAIACPMMTEQGHRVTPVGCIGSECAHWQQVNENKGGCSPSVIAYHLGLMSETLSSIQGIIEWDIGSRLENIYGSLIDR